MFFVYENCVVSIITNSFLVAEIRSPVNEKIGARKRGEQYAGEGEHPG
jgi:hypothetical protein